VIQSIIWLVDLLVQQSVGSFYACNATLLVGTMLFFPSLCLDIGVSVFVVFVSRKWYCI
jgi:hypothetical protein